MPKPGVNAKQISSELARSLEDNELDEFKQQLKFVKDVDYDMDTHYGKEVGYKTILQLAIEEDDHENIEFVEALLEAGASARHHNNQLQSSPIHSAAEFARLPILQLLLKFTNNKADINATNKLGLTAFHILLARLLDIANLQNKPVEHRPDKISDEELDKDILELFDCLNLITKQKDHWLDFDNALELANEKTPGKISYKKLSTMTPLQILCSFQIWNAKPITTALHKKLTELVELILNKGVDPNATAAKNVVAGTVAGSTPPVILAATRGYHQVVEVFKKFLNTNFLIENKFEQTILHIVLKAGYYNKILVHGDETGRLNEETLYSLFKTNSGFVQRAMQSIINRQDSYGNTPLHYAKHYPNQQITMFLLKNGAKIDRNPQGSVNVNPKTLDEFFFKDCIEVSGDDVDDEEFSITIKYEIFATPDVDAKMDMKKIHARAQAWTVDIDKEPGKEKRKTNRKVDTKRLEHFADVDQFRFLLKHPVLGSFLEMELNYLKRNYIIDFLIYLTFVIVLYKFLGERFAWRKNVGGTLLVHTIEEWNYPITVTTILIVVISSFLILRELWQLIKLRKRYFRYFENMLEWTILLLVIFALLPDKILTSIPDVNQLQKHLAAFTFLLAFMQLYLLLVRVVPNTPIPLYINMFTTVLKSYTFILLAYFAFIFSFAFSFSMVFSNEPEATNGTLVTDDSEEEVDQFGNLGLSLVKTIVMFAGEMDYTDIPIKHTLGYVLFLLFVFLMVTVLMNILNGLAVSDIGQIQREVDTYYHVSIVETLAYSKFVNLLAEKVQIYPNMKPESQTLFGISIPGAKVYKVEADGKKHLYFNENTVKAAKDMIIDRQSQTRDDGQKMSMEGVGENLVMVRKDQANMKARIEKIEEGISLILDVMQSRQPAVDR